ncbi:MAG TPA: hypothetical protein VK821_04910 [Dehalococcoidia bacterium]|nr:hypothetical protein [Dehalococcoidia bacterium]
MKYFRVNLRTRFTAAVLALALVAGFALAPVAGFAGSAQASQASCGASNMFSHHGVPLQMHNAAPQGLAGMANAVKVSTANCR